MPSAPLRLTLHVVAVALALAPGAARADSGTLEGELPQGVWLSAELGVGGVGGDAVAQPSMGVGVESQAFALHLRAPLALRVVDLPPTVSEPAGCAHFRCEEWLDADGGVSPAALSRLVLSARLFHPGDAFSARAGGLLMTLGQGALVRSYTNAAEWDRRRSGLGVEANLPWGRTQVQAFVASVLFPVDLSGVRVSTSPMFDGAAQGVGARFLGRLRVGVEAALDPLAPARDVGLTPGTRPVVGSAVDVAWPLLEEPGALQLTPFVIGSGVRGLAGSERLPALGTAAGLHASLDLIVVALRGGVRVTLDQPGHRSGVFSTLYDVDRKRMVAVAPAARTFLGVGAAEVPNPGGPGGAVEVELMVLRALRGHARLLLSPTVEHNQAEVGVDVVGGGVVLGARLLERAFTTPAELLAWDPRTFFVLEGAWTFFGPLSAFVRAQHALRFHDDARGLSADDDVLVGVSFDLVFGPP